MKTISCAAALAAMLTAMAGTSASAAAPSAAPLPDLAAYRGKIVYLDFWASWCGPCKMSFPFMEDLQRRYAGKGLVVLAVNVDHARDRADAFLEDMPHDFQVAFDPRGALATRMKVRDMPTSMVLGRDGQVLMVHRGFAEDDAPALADQIGGLLDAR